VVSSVGLIIFLHFNARIAQSAFILVNKFRLFEYYFASCSVISDVTILKAARIASCTSASVPSQICSTKSLMLFALRKLFCVEMDCDKSVFSGYIVHNSLYRRVFLNTIICYFLKINAISWSDVKTV